MHFASHWYTNLHLELASPLPRRRQKYCQFTCSTRPLLDFELRAKAGLACLINQLSAEARLTRGPCPQPGTKGQLQGVIWCQSNQACKLYTPSYIPCRTRKWPVRSATSTFLRQILSQIRNECWNVSSLKKNLKNLYALVEIHHVSYPTKAQKYLSKIQNKLEAAGNIQEALLFNLKRSEYYSWMNTRALSIAEHGN